MYEDEKMKEVQKEIMEGIKRNIFSLYIKFFI
jgi:hypothetical protein